MTVQTVAMLTAGGLAPCLSSAVGGLIERYTEVSPEVRIIGYLDGYAGLLTGRSIEVTDEVRRDAGRLHHFGGSPLGNSRVKLTNVDDCVRRGLVPEGGHPLRVAAEQLQADGVDVLHTIGGDDTNTTAADLAAYLAEHGYDLQVVGLPKTIDNDVIPIRQSLGAWTAAEQGSIFARNVLAEHSSNPRMLIIHEVMGRHCGWLAAATAQRHHEWAGEQQYVPAFGNDEREAERLRATMDEIGCVNIFLSEGAGVDDVVAQLEAAGAEVPRDPFGHVQLDKVNPGAWFAEQFAQLVGADKVMVQKSGYYSRSAAANSEDLALIKACTDKAVEVALDGGSGVVGHDEERGDELRAIEFERIAGGKAFDASAPWFVDLLRSIGQA